MGVFSATSAQGRSQRLSPKSTCQSIGNFRSRFEFGSASELGRSAWGMLQLRRRRHLSAIFISCTHLTTTSSVDRPMRTSVACGVGVAGQGVLTSTSTTAVMLYSAQTGFRALTSQYMNNAIEI